MDLDYRIEMIIFESILTIFEASIIFVGSWGNIGNWLEPKNKPPLRILTKLILSKSVIRTVELGAVLLVKLNGIFFRQMLCAGPFPLYAKGFVQLTPGFKVIP